MFEKATRLKLRFDSPKGLLTAEDLFDLPLTSVRYANLNDLAKALNRDLKDAGEEDFVNRTSKPNEILELKFNLVKHVIDVRLAENEQLRMVADKKAKKEKLLALIADKQDEQLKGASLDDLQKMVNEL